MNRNSNHPALIARLCKLAVPVIACLALLGMAAGIGGAILYTKLFPPALPQGMTLGVPGFDINCMAFARDQVFVAGRDGAEAISKNQLGLVPSPVNTTDMSYVRNIVLDQDAVWFAHYEGISRLTDDKRELQSGSHGLPAGQANAIYQAKNGTIWAGLWQGAAKLENGEWQLLTKADGLLDDMVHVIFQSSDGSMFFGSYVSPRGGLSIRTPDNKWQHFSTGNGLPHNNINVVTEGTDGTVWVGTGLYQSGGAVAFRQTKEGNWELARTITRKDGLAGAKVRSLFCSPDGSVWFGSEYDGLAILATDGSWHYLGLAEGLPSAEVKCIAPGENNSVWIGTRLGLIRLHGEYIDGIMNSDKSGRDF